MKHLLRITPPVLAKFNFAGLLCSLLLLASCHNKDNEPIPGTGEPCTVTITVSAADEMQTRAVNENEDSELTRCLVQIGGTVYEMELSSTKTEATYTVTLTTGTPDTFLFWADDGTYTATDLTAITPGEDGPGIAYAATADWDGFSDAVSAELKLAVSKVTLKTTTNLPAGNPVTLTLSHAYGGYDVSAGTCTGQATEKPYTYTPASGITADKDNPKEVFSFYALTNGSDSQTVTLECVNLTTRTEEITLAPGKHLVLTGDVGSGTTQNVGITATISDMWAVEEVALGFSKKLTDATVASASLNGSGIETDPYLITSAADFKCYMENNRTYGGTYVRLETDIEIATTGWTPIEVKVGGTFDGNNHTISGQIICETSDGRLEYGVFGTVQLQSKVQNLKVSANISVTEIDMASVDVGGIAGAMQGEGTITGCSYSGKLTVEGRVELEAYIGGIAGNSSGTISYCTFSGTIDAGLVWSGIDKRVDGIAGRNNGILDSNTVSGTIR